MSKMEEILNSYKRSVNISKSFDQQYIIFCIIFGMDDVLKYRGVGSCLKVGGHDQK